MEKQLTKKRNWEELVLEEDTTFSRELLQTYEEGNIEELGIAIKMYYESSKTSAELELLNHLESLMENIILLKVIDKLKTQEQWEKICRLRVDVKDDLEWNYNLNEESIKKEWNDAFYYAKNTDYEYIEKAKQIKSLTWHEVFEKSYHPSNYGK